MKNNVKKNGPGVGLALMHIFIFLHYSNVCSYPNTLGRYGATLLLC